MIKEFIQYIQDLDKNNEPRLNFMILIGLGLPSAFIWTALFKFYYQSNTIALMCLVYSLVCILIFLLGITSYKYKFFGGSYIAITYLYLVFLVVLTGFGPYVGCLYLSMLTFAASLVYHSKGVLFWFLLSTISAIYIAFFPTDKYEIMKFANFPLSDFFGISSIIVLNTFFGWYNTRRRRISLNNFEDEYSNRLHIARLSQQTHLLSAISSQLDEPLKNIASKVNSLKKIYRHDNYQKYLIKIDESSRRIDSIIQSLMVIDDDNNVGILKKISVNSIIEDLLSDVKQLNLDDSIDVIVNKVDDINLYGDKVNINQILLNLFKNASEVIKNQPTRRIFIKTFIEGKHVKIQIIDNGPGLNEELRSNIFTPFFTTKEIGKGMGLGLSLSYALAKKMEGELILKDYQETTFELKLKLV